MSVSTGVSFVDHMTHWKSTAFFGNVTGLSPPPVLWGETWDQLKLMWVSCCWP